MAQDEFYWREIQEAFTLDRTLTNLNNGNSCPSPRVVHEAVKRYMDMANMLPVQYNNMIGRNIGTVRRRLAAEFGCDASELALTRNASESLQIAQNGLDMKPGDEVLTTEQDYPRMLTTWDQRVRRDKIKVTRIQFPVPTTQDDLYQRFERAITPQTRVLHFCHITNLTGQLFPVQRLSRLARSRGMLTIVDGAHALAHFPFKLRDLECDYYGVSLHKWLLAPLGNGLLYVRKENIAKTSPSSRRLERIRRRCVRRWPRRSHSIRRLAPSARRRGFAISRCAGPTRSRAIRRSKFSRTSNPDKRGASRWCRSTGSIRGRSRST